MKPEELVQVQALSLLAPSPSSSPQAIKLYMERVRALDQVEDESNKVTEETIGQVTSRSELVAC